MSFIYVTNPNTGHTNRVNTSVNGSAITDHYKNSGFTISNTNPSNQNTSSVSVSNRPSNNTGQQQNLPYSPSSGGQQQNLPYNPNNNNVNSINNPSHQQQVNDANRGIREGNLDFVMSKVGQPAGSNFTYVIDEKGRLVSKNNSSLTSADKDMISARERYLSGGGTPSNNQPQQGSFQPQQNNTDLQNQYIIKAISDMLNNNQSNNSNKELMDGLGNLVNGMNNNFNDLVGGINNNFNDLVGGVNNSFGNISDSINTLGQNMYNFNTGNKTKNNLNTNNNYSADVSQTNTGVSTIPTNIYSSGNGFYNVGGRNMSSQEVMSLLSSTYGF